MLSLPQVRDVRRAGLRFGVGLSWSVPDVHRGVRFDERVVDCSELVEATLRLPQELGKVKSTRKQLAAAAAGGDAAGEVLPSVARSTDSVGDRIAVEQLD